MSKRVTVEELAANLREHIAEVKRGEIVSVLELGRKSRPCRPAKRPRMAEFHSRFAT